MDATQIGEDERERKSPKCEYVEGRESKGRPPATIFQRLILRIAMRGQDEDRGQVSHPCRERLAYLGFKIYRMGALGAREMLTACT